MNDDHDDNEVHAAARRNNNHTKRTQKTYADHRNSNADHNDLQVGDTVSCVVIRNPTSYALSKPLARVFNLSLKEGVVPLNGKKQTSYHYLKKVREISQRITDQ